MGPWDRGWGVCIKVSLKFEPPDFLEHSRQQRSSFLLETSWPLHRTRLRPVSLRVMLVRRVCCCYFPATEVGSHRLGRETHRETHRTWEPGVGVTRGGCVCVGVSVLGGVGETWHQTILQIRSHAPARIRRNAHCTHSPYMLITGVCLVHRHRPSLRPDLCPLRAGEALHRPASGRTQSLNQGAHTELDDRKGDVSRRINMPVTVCKVMHTGSIIPVPSPM